MARVKTKTEPFDWIMIRWARACEENALDVAPSDYARAVESQLEFSKDPEGRLADPLASLTLRADAMLSESKEPFGRRALDLALKAWFASLAFAVALGAIVFPFSRVDTILGDSVNLAGSFVFFLLTQIFFLAVSALFAVIMLIQSVARLILGKDRPITRGERIVRSLSSVVGGAVIWTLRKSAPIILRFIARSPLGSFMRRHAEPESSSARVASQVRRQFWNTLFSQPRFLLFWGGLLSHLFWISCSVCVLAILVVRMQGNRYDYCWHTSLEDERVVKQFVDFLGAPVKALGCEVPTAEDVNRLFDGSLSRVWSSPSPAPVDASSHARTRSRWSYFLLALVFVWCVAPRFVFALIYFLLTRRALHDFLPNLTEPYYQEIVKRIESIRTTTSASYVEEPEDQPFAEEEPLTAPANPIWNKTPREETPESPPNMTAILPELSYATAEQAHDQKEGADLVESTESRKSDLEPATFADEQEEIFETEPEPTPEPSAEALEERRLLDFVARHCGVEDATLDYVEPAKPSPVVVAFGYDADLPVETWRDLVGDVELACFGDVAKFANKRAFNEWLDENTRPTPLCAFITDVSLPPARHFVKFIRDVLTVKLSGARIAIILSYGERLRRKYASSPAAVAERLQDWSSSINFMAKASGERIDGIFYYDSELDLPEQRARLRTDLQSSDASTPIERAREFAKWDAASATILDACREIFESPSFVASEESDRLRVAATCDAIFKIYRAELATASSRSRLEHGVASRVRDALDAARSSVPARSVLATGERLAAQVAEKGLNADFIEKRMLAAVGLSGKLREYGRKLSPRCALAAATLGASAPALVLCAPLLGGAVTAATIASTLGALTTILPSSLASGAVAGALGALAPSSFAACKRKLLARLRGSDETAGSSACPSSASTAEGNGSPEDPPVARAESAAALALACATWGVVLELQGLDEDELVEKLPDATRALESANLDSLDAIGSALYAVRESLAAIPAT